MRLPIDIPPRNGEVGLFLLTPDHVSEAYVSWLNDPLTNQYLESRYTIHTAESTRAFVASILGSPNNLLLGIRSPDSHAHVGNIKLGPINETHGSADIGILIGERAAWGKGIATSAITRLADVARTQLGLRKLTAGCYASNVGSKKAFEKAGFEIEGVRKAQFLMAGHPEDLVLLGLVLK